MSPGVERTFADIDAACTTELFNMSASLGPPDDLHTVARWVPNRAGIINVWRYADEVFEFHRGRLLLHGPNGSGKSMALELLFPLLFDARLHPARLSSSTRSRGSLHDRITSGVGSTGSGRTGFLWAEFMRCAGGVPDGELEAVTIGVRLRASAGGRVDHAWFTSRARVGSELNLLRGGTPLSHADLRAELERNAAGCLHETPAEYRRAVRGLLFEGMTADQYEALVGALLALRVEKVSQNISADRLDEILRGSLPALDEHELATIAEGFEKLDRRREEIVGLERELELLSALSLRQRRYARAVLHAEAAAVISAATVRDRVTRDQRLGAERLGHERAALTAARQSEDQASATIDELQTRIETLRAAPAYLEGGRLEQLRRDVRAAQQAEDRASTSLHMCEQRRTSAAAAHDTAGDELAAADTTVLTSRERLNELAEPAGATSVLAAIIPVDTPGEAVDQLRAWVGDQRTAIEHVRGLLGALDAANAARFQYEHALQTAREHADSTRNAHQQVERDHDAQLGAFHESVRTWATAVGSMDNAALIDSLARCASVDDAALAAQLAAASVREAMAVRHAQLDRDQQAIRDQRSMFEQQQAALQAGTQTPPPAPEWRRDRHGAHGASFWQIVEFAPGADDALTGQIETALAASGLLDAWVSADGRVQLGPDEADVVVRALAPVRAPSDTAGTLAEVLIPDPASALDADVVWGVLASIALVDDAVTATDELGDSLIGRDGSFRLGALTGRGAPRPASYVGAAARERSRLQQLATLATQIGELDARLEQLAAHSDRQRELLDSLKRELDAFPGGDAVRTASSALEAAAALAEEAERGVQRAQQALRVAEQAARTSLVVAETAASDVRLPLDVMQLAERSRSLDALIETALAWSSAAAAQAGAARHHGSTAAALASAQDALAERRIETDHNARRRGRLASQVDELERSVGAEYAQLVQRIDAARTTQDELKRVCSDSRQEIERLVGQSAKLEAELETLEARRGEAEAGRERAHTSFAAAVQAGLLTDTGLEQLPRPALDGVGAVLEAARLLAQQLRHETAATADHRVLIQRALTRLVEMVAETARELAGRIEVSLDESGEGWSVLRLGLSGTRRPAPEVTALVAEQLRESHEELLDGERELFDRTLTGGIREHLAHRIRQAGELVEGINSALKDVRTAAAGVGARLRWEVDPDHEDAELLRQARRLLLRDPADLDAEQRAALHSFLRARIDIVRELEHTSGWKAQLEQVLDYRRWHRFRLQVAHQMWEGFEDATSARMQRLSTGERAVVLHLPMLASIAAHYDAASAAGATGPRLILLDELFVGVDPDNRSQLLGMLERWDLDAVLTSDNEWCTYATLLGIAIHHVHNDAEDELVTTSRFVWNGRERVEAPVSGAAM